MRWAQQHRAIARGDIKRWVETRYAATVVCAALGHMADGYYEFLGYVCGTRYLASTSPECLRHIIEYALHGSRRAYSARDVVCRSLPERRAALIRDVIERGRTRTITMLRELMFSGNVRPHVEFHSLQSVPTNVYRELATNWDCAFNVQSTVQHAFNTRNAVRLRKLRVWFGVGPEYGPRGGNAEWLAEMMHW